MRPTVESNTAKLLPRTIAYPMRLSACDTGMSSLLFPNTPMNTRNHYNYRTTTIYM